MKVKLTLLEEMLGTKPANKKLFDDFIGKKCPDEDLRQDELETAEHMAEQGSTIFHRNGPEGAEKIGIYDYQIKGFFKDACKSLRSADNTLSKKLTAYKKKIDGLIFVKPRFIFVEFPGDPESGLCERPARVDTPQGERVTLMRSETVPAGSVMRIEIISLAKELETLIEEWLDYGALRGLGQWRNSGKGIFEWEEE